ncbi:cytochrome C oxidase subunit IV family protein [Crocinitomix catalasitica]|nr:cytochrome C oxidase subunit IV family protein [Crocinitomix catalasitica]
MIRDDITEYSLDYHHSEEEGVKVRKKIYFVTILLSVVTVLEVGVGVYFPRSYVGLGSWGWFAIKMGYIALTVVKAGYIVLVFMHLGDEYKSLRRMILWPYILFLLYLIFILYMESSYINDAWDTMEGSS